MIALLAALALAEPACEPDLTAPGATLSVAWVSPLSQRVGRRGWLEVVRTTDLRAALRDRGGLARALQLLGLRRRGAPPSRRWKVTVFDVRAVDLCRPIDGYDEGEAVAGVVTCPARLARPDRGHDGCGWTLDRADGSRGLETFRVRWEDAARDGFCVLPAERFVAGG